MSVKPVCLSEQRGKDERGRERREGSSAAEPRTLGERARSSLNWPDDLPGSSFLRPTSRPQTHLELGVETSALVRTPGNFVRLRVVPRGARPVERSNRTTEGRTEEGRDKQGRGRAAGSGAAGRILDDDTNDRAGWRAGRGQTRAVDSVRGCTATRMRCSGTEGARRGLAS